MPLYRVQAVGESGLLNDQPLSGLSPAAFNSATNVRCRDRLVELIYGHSELSNGDTPSFAPYFCTYLGDAYTGYWLLLGLAKAYASQSGSVAWQDVSRAAGDFTGTIDNRWAGGVLNGISVLTNGKDTPQVWTDPSSTTPLVDLPNWTATTLCKSIRPFRNYLVAMNITKSGPAYYPHMVKWSHPADPGTYPSSWDETDATVDAGETDLPGADHLVDGGMLQDFFVLYKERSTHIMQFIGGQYIFKFSQAFSESGIMSQNCWAELNGQHVVFTASDLVIHNGSSMGSILNSRMRRWLFQNSDADNIGRSFIVKQHYFNEVWLCYPAPGESYCTQALVWNWKDNTITVRDLPDITHADSGPASNTVESTWSGDSGTWEGDDLSWNASEFTPSLQRVVMAAPATKQLFLADSTSRFAGTLINGELVRSGLDFEKPEVRKLVRGIRPRMYGDGNVVTFQLGGQDTLYGPIRWGSEISFTVGDDFKSDHMTEGRYITFRMTSATDRWRLEAIDFDIEFISEF